MREVILDTETTGLDPVRGDRVVEIGCIEIFNQIPTGEVFQVYLNPERDMPMEAFRIHNLSSEFLSDKPLFRAVVPELLAFLADDPIVIHNAEFDVKFLNAELSRENLPPLGMHRVRDTLAMARRKFPGSPNSLDALCTRFHIDSSRRVKHGALLDAEILADVYIELNGGRQAMMQLASAQEAKMIEVVAQDAARAERPARLPALAAFIAHGVFVETLGGKSKWKVFAGRHAPA